jgi:PAS domain S-box-containing protein
VGDLKSSRSLRHGLVTTVRGLPLRIKLGVPLIAVSVITALALGAVMGLGASRRINRSYAQHAHELSGYINAGVTSAETDRASAEAFVRQLMSSDASLRSIRVFQGAVSDGSIYAGAGGQADMPSTHDLQLAAAGASVQEHSTVDGQPTLEYITPLWAGGRFWGIAEIDYSLAVQTTAIAEVWRDTALVTGLGLAIELALFWFLFNSLVLEKLRRLAAVATGLAGHDLEQERLQPGGNPGADDIAIVGDHIDNLVLAMRRRADQDQLLFTLGLRAARAGDLTILLREMAAAVQYLMPNAVLVAEELAGDDSDMYIRTFASSDPDLDPQPPMKLGNSAVLNYIITSGEDVFYEDGNGEDRFDISAIVARDVCCGLGVIIPGELRPYGVLAAYSGEAHAFKTGDMGFFRSLATLIGATAARLQADRDRLSSEARLQDTFATSPAGIIFIDPRNGTILDANLAFCETLGYQADELRSLGVLDIVHPDDIEWAATEIASAGTPGSANPDQLRFEQRFVAKDGAVVWMQLSASLVRDSAGEPSYFQATCIDVTERKTAETTLQSTLSLLRRTGEDRQRLMRSLMRAQQEQAESANHLHHHVTQVLVGSALELERLGSLAADADTARSIEQTRAAVEGAVADLRSATDRRKDDDQKPSLADSVATA